MLVAADELATVGILDRGKTPRVSLGYAPNQDTGVITISDRRGDILWGAK